jgi:phage tail sheath protein FI
MAELTFKSAGVSTREIDLSQPTRSGPVGVPAGIIGTANEGPAFVPLTFANYSDFAIAFGQTDGEKFGPLAVHQWLSNAQAVTYMRVLGAGNGQKRTSTGDVTNAGFTVGGQIVQENGIEGNNSYATLSKIEGRTYFLGALLSESNGSTLLSSAGIQTAGENKAAPILRGVLLAPSGVILHLSGTANANGNTPVKGQTAANSSLSGRAGGVTGSIDLASQEFVMLLNGYNNTNTSKYTHITASLDVTAPNYFANVFNTDPFKIEEEGHLLYSSYDLYPDLVTLTGSGVITVGEYSDPEKTKEDIVFLLTSSIERGGDAAAANIPDYEAFNDRFSEAYTPWVISQKFGNSPKNLFKIHLLSPGKNTSNKFKFSIENIKKSNTTIDNYGTFDLVIRDFNDDDNNVRVLESFRGLNLDPYSDRYIGRVVGDQHIYFNFDVNADSQKIIVDGTHPVRSRYVRVEVSDDVANANISKESLPLGHRGPNHLVTSGSLLTNPSDSTLYTINTTLLQGVSEPPIPLRETIAQGTGIQKRVDNRLYWGTQFTRKTSATLPNKSDIQDKSLQSFVKYFPDYKTSGVKFSAGNNAGAANVNGSVLDSDLFNYNKFSLENIQVRTGSDTYADPDQWHSASYVRNGVITANSTNKTRAFNINDLSNVSNAKFAKFTFFAQGGFDGVNIFDEEKSKLTNVAAKREMDNEAGVLENTVQAYRKAIDIMSSKADVDIQLLATPGIRHPSVTDYAIQKVEQRFDAMYIMDIEERDQVNTVITSSVQKPNVGYTVSDFKNRALDSSFAAAYFPDVVVRDPTTQALVQVPPSVAILGAYSLNDKLAHPWYAPAGFTRGALNTVEIPSVKLNRTNLDDLYSADINPIVEFPGIGITIWGQKTLQAADSALDRINVRRLLIDVRRKVRNIANVLLFEPNREETLDKFTALVNPILQRVQDQSGIDRYKAVIDTSTTTQADVENNTIRGKIYLQPTRTVEFVALDFVVTNAGSNI